MKRTASAFSAKATRGANARKALLQDIPTNLGEWAERSIKRWSLVAPFDPNVTEEEWEAYFKERATLEWDNAAKGAYPLGDDPNKKDLPPWTEDFPNPLLETYSRRESDNAGYSVPGDTVQNHLKTLRSYVNRVFAAYAGFSEKGDKAATGVYVLAGGWSDAISSFELYTRFYSPCALGTSIDMFMTTYDIPRSSIKEYENDFAGKLRSARDCDPKDPLYSAMQSPNGDEVPGVKQIYRVFCVGKRRDFGGRVASQSALSAIQKQLFGESELLDSYDMWMILVSAGAMCGIEQVREATMKTCLKYAHRKYVLGCDDCLHSDPEEGDEVHNDDEGRDGYSDEDDDQYYEDFQAFEF